MSSSASSYSSSLNPKSSVPVDSFGFFWKQCEEAFGRDSIQTAENHFYFPKNSSRLLFFTVTIVVNDGNSIYSECGTGRSKEEATKEAYKAFLLCFPAFSRKIQQVFVPLNPHTGKNQKTPSTLSERFDKINSSTQSGSNISRRETSEIRRVIEKRDVDPRWTIMTEEEKMEILDRELDYVEKRNFPGGTQVDESDSYDLDTQLDPEWAALTEEQKIEILDRELDEWILRKAKE